MEVEVVLLTDREVELALERMENEIHLIHDQHTLAEEA